MSTTSSLRRAYLRRLGASVLAPVLASSLVQRAALAASDKAVTLRFSHVVAEETPKGLAAKRFKQLAEQRSGGHIRVLIYPDAQLYGDHDEMQALQLGAVDMLAPSLSKFGRIGFPRSEERRVGKECSEPCRSLW